MKIFVSLVAFALALSIGSSSLAEEKPFACAYDQFTPDERAKLGREIVALQQSGNEQAMSDLEKKDSQIVGQKVFRCPNFKTMNDQQQTVAFGYAMTALMKDGVNASYPTYAGKSLVDDFWEGLPDDARLSLIEAAHNPNKDEGQKALNNFMSSPHISQYINAKKLDQKARLSLIAGTTAKMFLISLEDYWKTGAPIN